MSQHVSEGFDVFLCYAWEDKRQADALRAALERAGLRVFQDESGMRDYDYIPAMIESALRRSRVLVALYTPAFPSSEYCRQELHFALVRSYALDRGRAGVMAVVRGVDFDDVRPARLRLWRLPSSVQDLDTTAREIAAKVREDRRRLGDTPDPPAPAWYPRPLGDPAELHGRELELWQLHDALFPDNGPRAGGQVVAVTGLGGQGKTMLAEQYARLFAADFPGGIFVLRGFGGRGWTGGAAALVQELLHQQLADIARRLPGVAVRERVDLAAALHRHLENGPPYLWIVDDVPAGMERASFDALLAPSSNGRTLVTAMHDLRGWVRQRSQIRLSALDRSAALAVLTSRWPAGSTEDIRRRLERLRRDRREYRAAGALADDQGRHPLALALAAGLAGSAEFTSFAELRGSVARHERTVLTLAAALQVRLPTDHQANIAATLLRSVGELADHEGDVLRLASAVAAAPIPQPLFRLVLAEADRLTEAEAEKRATAGLAGAAARFLAQPVDGGTARLWNVHPLVTRAVRHTDTSPVRLQQLRSAAVVALTRELERSRGGPLDASLGDWLPHVGEVAAAMRNVDEWHLLNEAGRLHSELGDSRAALALFAKLYDACRNRLGDNDVTTLTVLVGLGVAYGLHGDHATARTLAAQAYAGLRDRLGDDHPDTLTALNNLAVAADQTGDHQAARGIYATVYRARRRQLGVYHPGTLDALMNYTIAVGRCGQHGRAQRLKRQVYELSRAINGDEHPRTLDALNNVAAAAAALGDRETSAAMFRQVYQARRRLLGRVRDTASALENLAATVADGEIAALLEEAYRIRVAAQGPQHPETQRALRLLLAALLRAPGDMPPATAPTAQLVEVLPADVDLGEVRLDDERMDERIELFELASQVYDARLAALGPDDPVTMTAVCYLAHAHAALGQMDRQVDEAWALIDDAADGLSVALGPTDPAAELADQLRAWIAGIGAAE
jgi:hypothetical protein